MSRARDPSHVRSYTSSEWVAALARAGLEVVSFQPRRLRIEFAAWISRTRTPTTLAEAVRLLQERAPAEVRDYFAIEPDGTFMLDTIALETRPV